MPFICSSKTDTCIYVPGWPIHPTHGLPTTPPTGNDPTRDPGDPTKPGGGSGLPIFLDAKGAPGVYPALHLDVSLLAAIRQLTGSLTDATCRGALQAGIDAGLHALRQRTHGEIARITLD